MTPMLPPNQDPEIQTIQCWLAEPRRLELTGIAIRTAIDGILNGQFTGRYDIAACSTQEKNHLGTVVERELIDNLGLEKKLPFDTWVQGIPVDVKWSLSRSWMIPPEAFNFLAPPGLLSPALCILIRADDRKACFDMGLLRAYPQYLNKENRDKKRSISQLGYANISWVCHAHPMPENFLLNLNPTELESLFQIQDDQMRIAQFFRNHLETPIPKTAILTMMRQSGDPLRRLRDDKYNPNFVQAGIKIFSYMKNTEIRKLGLSPVPQNYWLAVDREKFGIGDCA